MSYSVSLRVARKETLGMTLHHEEMSITRKRKESHKIQVIVLGKKLLAMNPKVKRSVYQRRTASSNVSIRDAITETQGNFCAGLIEIPWQYTKTRYYICDNEPTDCDHILELRYGGTDTEDNLQMLCRECHVKKTSANCKKQYVF
jgi:hypothetical protein